MSSEIIFSSKLLWKSEKFLSKLSFDSVLTCWYTAVLPIQVRGFKPEARASWRKCQIGEQSGGGSASSGKCKFGTIFYLLIHFYLMNATNEHYVLSMEKQF